MTLSNYIASVFFDDSIVYDSLFGEGQGSQMKVYDQSPPIEVYIQWTCFFAILDFLCPLIYRRIYPKIWESLGESKKYEFPSYCFATVHHIYVACLGLKMLFRSYDLYSTTGLAVDIELLQLYCSVIPVTFGYIFVDTFFAAVPEYFRTGKKEFVLHHICAFGLIFGELLSPLILAKYIPHMLVCETSGVLFGTAWHLRNHGYRNTSLLKGVEIGFAVCFFIARILNLPMAMSSFYYYHWKKSLLISATVVPILGLQFYWFYKIIVTLTKSSKPSSSVKKEA